MIQSALWWEIWWTCLSTYFNLAILLQLSQVYAPYSHILKLDPLTIDRALWNSPPVALLGSLRQTNSFLVPSYGFNCWLMCHRTNEQWGVKTPQLVFLRMKLQFVSIENTWTDKYITGLLFYFKQQLSWVLFQVYKRTWFRKLGSGDTTKPLCLASFHFSSPENWFLANHWQ